MAIADAAVPLVPFQEALNDVMGDVYPWGLTDATIRVAEDWYGKKTRIC
jgi:hypothetical protein